jgi:ABC-type multidrug transport system fused ATPase/permease subunit
MIRRLYKEYRIQIIIAFTLVILENFAYVAEPYVFGKAIDGLREAHSIEEEVDSSLSTIQRREIADSIRARVVDSMKMVDSLQRIDSLQSSLESIPQGRMGQMGPTEPEQSLPSSFIPNPSSFLHLASFFVGDKNKSAVLDSEIVPMPAEGTPERARIDSIRRKLARHDSIRSHLRRSKHPQMTREAARDSIRKAMQARKSPPSPGKPAGTTTQPSKQPLAFYAVREIGPFLPPLIPWVLLFLINSSIGAFRRSYDTRTYTKMFSNLASDVVARQLAQGEDLSKVAARSSMAWHNIEFFQYNVPEFLEQLIAVGGAVIALGLFDWRLTVVGSVLIVFVVVGSKYYMKSLTNIQSSLHDQYEDEYNVFGTREPGKIRSYYSGIADLEIRYSLRSTLSYGVVRFFLLIMFLSTLYISIDLDKFTIGALYSIVAYVWSFVTATEYIPYLSEKWVELKDASRRITEPLPEP